MTARTGDTALDRALARLVAAGTLDEAQAAAVRAELALVPPGAEGAPGGTRVPTGWTAVLAEVGGYVGATFVIAAAAALTGPFWDDLPDVAQFCLLVGPAVLLLIAAGAVAAAAPGRWRPSGESSPRRRLVAALVVVAGLLAAGAATVPTSEDAQLRASSVVALVVFAVGYAGCRSALLHVAAAVAAVTATFALTDWASDTSPLAEGWVLVLLGAVWASATLAGVLVERALGFVAGGVIVFFGAELLATDSGARSAVGYLLLAALAVAGLAGYAVRREVPLLAVGALTLAVVVPQAVIDWTDGALGAAGALLVSGLSIVAASVLALRLRDTPPSTPHPRSP